MACVRFRRGKWVVDWRDQWNKRKWLSFPGTPEGEAAAKVELERIERGESVEVAAGITLGDYIEHHWLPVTRKRVDALTLRAYEMNARKHIPAALKRLALTSITRPQLKKLLAVVGEQHKLAEATVAKVANVVRGIFESALDDGIIQGNPASGLRAALGIVHHKAEDVRAMDSAELEVFLAAARVHVPAHYLEMALLAYMGIRIGELRGLQLGDVDTEERTILVERQVYDDGRIGHLKGRRGKKRPRVVDMADALRDVLVPTLAARRVDAMRSGARGPWLAYPDWPAPIERDGEPFLLAPVSTVIHRLRRAMAAALKRAKLGAHFTPHSLRHTYARILLERGEDPLYVSRQLGHASTGITTDLYGQWARVRPRAGGANLLTGRG